MLLYEKHLHVHDDILKDIKVTTVINLPVSLDMKMAERSRSLCNKNQCLYSVHSLESQTWFITALLNFISDVQSICLKYI